ncbi:MAG: carbohydrate ABC transporter permease [Chloroflexota bacterium]|jgi:sorbitol/mannitol transport system permease protein|nr:carbohydrate ABC transporter permease [Chloroflexota bacterium]
MATISTTSAERLRRFRSRRSRSREDAPLWVAVLAWIVALIVFFPVFYMVITSFKFEPAAVALPPQLIFNPTFENYATIFNIDFLPFFANSIIASVASTVVVMLLGVPAAYALALHPPKRAKDALFFFISTRFLPPAGVIVPLYIIFRDANLLGTVHGLIILYTAMNLPIAIWMLRSFFEEVPRDVLDAARVDGAGLLREMTQIVLPMVVPGIVATMFLAIIFAWNEFFFAVSLASVGTATVPIFMVKYVTSEGLFWAQLSASTTLAVLPIVLLGWIAQRQLVRGLSMGAVK